MSRKYKFKDNEELYFVSFASAGYGMGFGSAFSGRGWQQGDWVPEQTRLMHRIGKDNVGLPEETRVATVGGYYHQEFNTGTINTNYWSGSSMGTMGYNPYGNLYACTNCKDDVTKSSHTSEALPIAISLSAADGPAPAGDLIGVGILASAAVLDITKRVYITYTLTNPTTGQIYAGRTSGFADPHTIMMFRFSNHHMRALGFTIPKLDMSAVGYPVGYAAIRGREQDIVDALGGIGNPRVGNSINPIWKYNPNRSVYLWLSKGFPKYIP